MHPWRTAMNAATPTMMIGSIDKPWLSFLAVLVVPSILLLIHLGTGHPTGLWVLLRRWYKWRARRGNLGGTASWATNVYVAAKCRFSHLEETEITRILIRSRYAALPSETCENHLLGCAASLQGLMGLVIEILKVEAALGANYPSMMVIFLDVIEEELRKSGLPDMVLFGTCRGRAEFMRQAYEQCLSFERNKEYESSSDE